MNRPISDFRSIASALPMDRVLFALLLSTLIGTQGRAQDWFPDEATWHYSYNSLFGQVGYVRIEVAGDTLINGQACRMLEPMREAYDYISGQYFTTMLDKIHVYEANGLVMAYASTPDAFDTLYNMNANPGDRWRLARLPDWQVCSQDSYIEVVDTGTTAIDGMDLRWLAIEVKFLPEELNIYLDTIIQRIGTTSLFMLPHDECNGWVDGHEAGGYRCYSDNEIAHSAPGGVPCEFTVGLHTIENSPSLMVYPNPGSEVNFRSSLSGRSILLQVYDEQGRKVHDGKIEPGVPLDLSHLATGIYTLKFEALDTGVLTTGRWVKQ